MLRDKHLAGVNDVVVHGHVLLADLVLQAVVVVVDRPDLDPAEAIFQMSGRGNDLDGRRLLGHGNIALLFRLLLRGRCPPDLFHGFQTELGPFRVLLLVLLLAVLALGGLLRRDGRGAINLALVAFSALFFEVSRLFPAVFLYTLTVYFRTRFLGRGLANAVDSGHFSLALGAHEGLRNSFLGGAGTPARFSKLRVNGDGLVLLGVALLRGLCQPLLDLLPVGVDEVEGERVPVIAADGAEVALEGLVRLEQRGRQRRVVLEVTHHEWGLF